MVIHRTFAQIVGTQIKNIIVIDDFFIAQQLTKASFGENSVERTTTLTVSHGMMSKYIDGVRVNGKLISYFNIIDFGLREGEKFENYLSRLKMGDWKGEVSKWKVNIDVFSYFLKRSQIL